MPQNATQESKERIPLKTIVRALSLAAGVLASSPTLAQDKHTADVRVDYSDLDLADPAAVRVLDRRLERAIRASCPNDDQVRDLGRLRSIIECRASKRAELKPQREAVLASASRTNSALAAR